MIQIPSHIKGLIFDLDGTVANTMQNHFTSWRKTVEPYGIDFTEELFLALTGMSRIPTLKKLEEMFDVQFDIEEAARLKGEYFHEMSFTTQKIDVVTDVIDKYHGILPMSIGTGSSKNGAKHTLEVIGYDKYFDIVITADDVAQCKPHPETFLKCAELMGVDPKECIVFEDGELGMIAAREVGMEVIDVNDHFPIKFIKEEI